MLPDALTHCQVQLQSDCPPGPMKKQVWFDLSNNLGDMLPLPADLVRFWGSATDEWSNVPAPTAMSS